MSLFRREKIDFEARQGVRGEHNGTNSVSRGQRSRSSKAVFVAEKGDIKQFLRKFNSFSLVSIMFYLYPSEIKD